MDPQRWERLWSLFHSALERAPGAEREGFLAAECGGDAALRAEVDSLLAAHDDPSAPELGDGLRAGLEAGLGAGSGSTPRLAEEAPPGSAIGPYRIVRRIGEGGMGIVYEAQQQEPVRRRVALKLIKSGMDTREVVRRFETERQALALMDHSSIARVFDAGATDEGRPYFAMELVDGPTLADYCDARRLPLRERVALFATVCRAVHSAHQKGVIHRDLKSSNVLVALEEGGPVPKVIDFGVARAIQSPFDGDSLVTRLGELVGTPETMSPEQAAMSADLDTRTDIYSLGALLYQLLCGARAFDFSDTPLPELLRRVREEEPAPPSARLAAPDAAIRAALRRTTAAQLRRELRGELDWIVARAMAKERERRYGSAAELAEDLERHLGDRPVAAGPPSRLYRARKLLRRHRIEATAAAALMLALVAFGVTMSFQSRRLARALAAEERERTAATQVSSFLVDLLEQPDPEIARGADPTVRQVLDSGTGKIERELAGQPEIQSRLLETIGRVQLHLGEYDRAAEAFGKALALRRTRPDEASPGIAALLQSLGEVDLDRSRYDSALAYAEQALAMRRRVLPAGDPEIATSLDLVAVVRRDTGRLAAAQKLHLEALAIRRAAFGESDPEVATSWNFLGIVRRWSFDTAGAEAAYRRALDIWRAALGTDHPLTATAMNNLALVLHVRGDHQASLRLFEELVPIRRRILGDAHPELQVTLANQAKLLHDMGELERAAALYEESLAVGRRGFGEEHTHMANALADYSGVLAGLGRGAEALAAARRSLEIRERLFGPESSAVAASLVYIARAHEALGRDDLAAPLHERAIELTRRTRPGEPRLAHALEIFGLFLLRRGESERARAALEEGVAILRAKLPPEDRVRARVEGSLGLCLLRLGRIDEAAPLLEASLAHLSVFETAETVEARARLAELERARAAAAAAL